MNYKRIVPWLVAAVALLAIWFGLRSDAFLYHQSVAQVVSVQTIHSTSEVDSNNNHDKQVTQRVRARFLNTSKRGQTVSFKNQYTVSEGVDFPLHQGQQVFLNRSDSGYQLNDVKRDTVTGVLLALVIMLLIMFSGKHSVVTMISIALNTAVFFAGIHLELGSHGNQPWYIVVGMALLFTVLTVLFVIGPRSVAVCIACSTILATAVAVALGYAIMVGTGYRGIHTEQVRYVTQNPRLIFFAQIVIGSLGAVLDETSDISVAIFQLPAAAGKRFKAGMAIGRNVMGPLISVLFMIFMADTFTESILWLRNGNTIAYTVSWVMGLGFVQSLISAFGIVLAVPITSGLAALLAGRRHTAK